jgi:cytochrome b
MDYWWVWVLIVVALVAIGWGLRRSRTARAAHFDQSAFTAVKNRHEGSAARHGDGGSFGN